MGSHREFCAVRWRMAREADAPGAKTKVVVAKVERGGWTGTEYTGLVD